MYQKSSAKIRKEDINFVFKRGKTLHSMIFNGKLKNNDCRNKDLIKKIPCWDYSLCYIGETAQSYDEREKQHKIYIWNHDENNALFRHVRVTGHDEHYAEKWRIFLRYIYAAKNGVTNPRDGTQKDTCWNTIITTR